MSWNHVRLRIFHAICNNLITFRLDFFQFTSALGEMIAKVRHTSFHDLHSFIEKSCLNFPRSVVGPHSSRSRNCTPRGKLSHDCALPMAPGNTSEKLFNRVSSTSHLLLRLLLFTSSPMLFPYLFYSVETNPTERTEHIHRRLPAVKLSHKFYRIRELIFSPPVYTFLFVCGVWTCLRWKAERKQPRCDRLKGCLESEGRKWGVRSRNRIENESFCFEDASDPRF